MKKRILSVLMALALCLSLLPATALAAENDTIWVGGVELNATDCYLASGENATPTDQEPVSDGYAHWDATNNTLTLDNYQYEGAGYNGAAIYYDGTAALTIDLIGESSVTHAESNAGLSYGLYGDGIDITIKGNGKLTAKGTAANRTSCGVYASSINLTEGATLEGIGGDAQAGAYGGPADSYGVQATTLITVENGQLIGTSGSVKPASTYPGDSFGVYSTDITVKTGELTGNGGNNITADNCHSSGVCLNGNGAITVMAGGSVNAVGGGVTGANSSSYGIYQSRNVDLPIRINGGTLTATGGQATTESYGVSATSITLVVGDGSITAQSTATGGTPAQAFNKAPSFGDNSTYAKVWYGNDGTAADNQGAKARTELSTNYSSKYVQVKKAFFVNVSANNGSMGTVTGSRTCLPGASATVTATPANGYIFKGWTKDGTQVSTNATYNFTPTEDVALVAEFEVDPTNPPGPGPGPGPGPTGPTGPTGPGGPGGGEGGGSDTPSTPPPDVEYIGDGEFVTDNTDDPPTEVLVDGEPVDFTGDEGGFVIDPAGLAPGRHSITIRWENRRLHTYFDYEGSALVIEIPEVPVTETPKTGYDPTSGLYAGLLMLAFGGLAAAGLAKRRRA